MYNHITHHLEKCMLFYWNLKWPPQIDFLNICDRKKSNPIYGGGWYRTSVLLLKYVLLHQGTVRSLFLYIDILVGMFHVIQNAWNDKVLKLFIDA